MVYCFYVYDYIVFYIQFVIIKFCIFFDYDFGLLVVYFNLEYIYNNIYNWIGGFDKYVGYMVEFVVVVYDFIFWMYYVNVDC